MQTGAGASTITAGECAQTLRCGPLACSTELGHTEALPAARSRLTATGYLAMSFLIVWHTTAMVLTILPDGAIGGTVRKVFAPYVTLLRLDNNWAFFAPNVPAGYTLRYVVEDAAGARHGFAPAEELNRYLPVSIWFRDRYRATVTAPQVFARALGMSLCREHAALRPVAITLRSVDQKDFRPADRRAGKDSLDDEFLSVRTLRRVRCAAP